MEIGLAILLFVCMTALLYVVLSLKITRQVDLQMKEFYKTRIHADIQEFYRTMEGYSVEFETRIKQFKALVERNEEAVRTHDAQVTQALPQFTEDTEIEEDYTAPELPVRRAAIAGKKTIPAKKAVKLSEAQRKAAEKAAKSAKAAPQPVMPAGKNKIAKAATPAARVNAAAKGDPRAFQSRVEEAPRVRAEVRPVAVAQPLTEPVGQSFAEADDTAIAEELMKDLFAQDQVKLTVQPAAKKPEAAVPAETAGERTMANFFSRIGKSVGPIVFGEKPAAEARKKSEPLKQAAAQSATAKPVADFSEVLRRAEQIKAEKKAERERAEVEARAEFYAVGDTMSPTTSRPGLASLATPGDTMSQVLPPAGTRSLAANGDTVSQPPPQRQNLAVKDLDQHTINFLIDSLKQENGYRKQALRALTENNIPLPEIARLSKIDIGELELMRQLGRF
ncbi:MAG: hypothetical protein U1F27_15570 [Turneriella sp.]